MTNTIKTASIKDRATYLMTQSNILSNQIAPNYYGIQKENTKAYIEELIKGFSMDINARYLLLDVRGNVQADAYDDRINTNLIAVPEVRAAIYGENRSNIYRLPNGENVMYVAVPVMDSNTVIGVVLASDSIDDINANVNKIMSRVLLLSMMGLLITGFISFVFADVISKPIENMRVLVNDFTKGKFDTRIQVDSYDEIGQLGETFNDMAAQIHQVDENRKQFVSNVSHELRTPLTSLNIISESLLLQDHWEEPVYREFLGDIESEVKRLNEIIDSLLYLVDVEKKELKLDLQLCYMNYLIENVLKHLKPIADQKHITMNFAEYEKVQISVDQGKIQQCLINVINNAVKYTPEGGNVTVQLSMDKTEVVIAVKDTGIGIPEDDLAKIFDRFYRVDRARARTTGGSGLGLSIVKQIVLLHNGSISVESAVNVGTTVFIHLPYRV